MSNEVLNHQAVEVNKVLSDTGKAGTAFVNSAPAAVPARVWRVGSLTMGITLIMIGTALAASIWQSANAYEMLLWVAPIVFIMLGAELLLYLKFSGSGRSVVKYDWMSVFFVGLIGTASLGVALLLSTGLVEELQRGLNVMQRTAFVSTAKIEVPSHVEKLVVQSQIGIDMDSSDSGGLQLIGQVRYWSADHLKQSDDKWLQTTISGNTMYVMVGAADRKDSGLVIEAMKYQLTLIVPSGIEIVRR